ncbi:hypothetical protein ACN47E_009992 [Coniothyrium glycines]
MLPASLQIVRLLLKCSLLSDGRPSSGDKRARFNPRPKSVGSPCRANARSYGSAPHTAQFIANFNPVVRQPWPETRNGFLAHSTHSASVSPHAWPTPVTRHPCGNQLLVKR